MPFIPAPDGVAKIRYTWSNFTSEAQNVFHVDTGLGAELTPAQCAQLLVIAEGALTNPGVGAQYLLGQISENWQCVGIEAEDASNASGAKQSVVVTMPGEKAEPSVPPGVAVVTTWYTGFRGRDKRGRTFWPGFPEGHVGGNGNLDTTQYDDFAAAVNGFHAAWEAGGAEFPDMVGLVVASYYHPVGAPPVTTPRAVAQITPIESVVVRQYVHSQRRRNPAG